VLTDKQRRFVAAFLLEENGTKAAITAGYAEKSAAVEASRLLRNAKVAAAIEAGRAPKAEVPPAELPLDQRVIAELQKIAFADIRNVVSWSPGEIGWVERNGEEMLAVPNRVDLKASAEIDEMVAAGIAEISQSSTGALKIKMHSKLTALTKLGEHLGLFRPLGNGETKKPGKKEAAQEAALTAGEGSDWGDDLNGGLPN
jgi:phage terminase small subunit